MKNLHRTEYKYLISKEQIQILRNRIENLFSTDTYCNNEQKYSVSSLYFDNYDNKCFYENENSCDPRRKYRIRIYNNSLNTIKLEQKNKINNKVIKYKCNLSFDQANGLIRGKYKINITENQDLLQSFMIDMMNERFAPVIAVCYDRYPYVCKNSNIRVTFDTNICFSKQVYGFLNNNFVRMPLYSINIMEIKYDNYIPDFILKILDVENLQRISFSKYFISRKNSLFY